MATPRARRPDYLYIKEWFDARGMSDEKVAEVLGVARETVWRRRTEQHRLNPKKIAELAAAIGIEPEQFYRPPGEESIDAMLKGKPADLRSTAADIVRRLVGKS